MITEDYVSFQTAKLLKEKGFDGECKRFANIDTFKNGYDSTKIITSKNLLRNEVLIPTLQMAMRWLRDTFHLEIYPFHDAIQESNNWWYRIEYHSKGCSLAVDESDAIYKTYEQACEVAIKYCLENLI